MKTIVTFGEIMARFAPPRNLRFQQAFPGQIEVTFAGAEASVAASLAFLGARSRFATALPKHPVADACVMDLRSLGVDTESIMRTSTGRLGIYYYEPGANQRPSNVIYDREGSSIAITPASAYEWDKVFADASWFVFSGITPAISKVAYEVTLTALQQANERNVAVLCDINYRSKLWNWEPSLSARELATRTMRELLPMVTCFVGGKEDAQEILGTTTRDATNATEVLVDLARQLQSEFPRLQHVAFSRREDHSASQTALGGFYANFGRDEYCTSPNKSGDASLYIIESIVDRLGAGDAFTAGLLYALTDPDLASSQSIIDFATAAGCLAHSVQGDYNYVSREEIRSLVAGSSSGRVLR